MSHATAPDQSRAPTRRTPAAPRPSYGAPAGYHGASAPEAAIAHPVGHEQLAEVLPADRERQRPHPSYGAPAGYQYHGVGLVASPEAAIAHPVGHEQLAEVLPADRERQRPHPSYGAPAGYQYHGVGLVASPEAAIAHTIGHEQLAEVLPADRERQRPHPSYGAPAGYQYHGVGLVVAHPVGHEQLAEVISANGEQQRPPRDWIGLLDEEQVGVAAVAVRAVLEDSIRRHIRLGRTPPSRPGAGSGGYLRYPSVHSLEAVVVGPGVRLLDPKSMEEMALALPDDADDAVEMLRRASICRLSDVVASPLILHADPRALVTEPTETVIKVKIATVLVCLIWRELNGQSWRFCQEVKEECFELVAGQCVEKLLEVARSFSDTSWCAGPVKDMLAIFGGLFDVLYNIQRLPLKKSEELAGISSKMVDAFSAVLEGTISDIDSSEESTIHLATVLIQFLEFFHDHRDVVQSMVSARYPCCELLKSWITRLEKDTEKISQDEKGGRYIFLLNKLYDISQVMRRSGASFLEGELESMLMSAIQRHRKSYFDECWVPLILSLLKGGYLKKPNHSSLDEFTQGFVSICNFHMTLKVRPGLKYELREEIKNVLVKPYQAYLQALQANPNRLSEVVYYFKRVMWRKKNQNQFTVEQLEQAIKQLYES